MKDNFERYMGKYVIRQVVLKVLHKEERKKPYVWTTIILQYNQ